MIFTRTLLCDNRGYRIIRCAGAATPSETGAFGGHGPPLALDRLSYPELTPARRKLIDELVALSGDAPAGLAVASALFGLLATDDPIPAYRLSAPWSWSSLLEDLPVNAGPAQEPSPITDGNQL